MPRPPPSSVDALVNDALDGRRGAGFRSRSPARSPRLTAERLEVELQGQVVRAVRTPRRARGRPAARSARAAS